VAAPLIGDLGICRLCLRFGDDDGGNLAEARQRPSGFFRFLPLGEWINALRD
jgi:hypothetical protein